MKEQLIRCLKDREVRKALKGAIEQAKQEEEQERYERVFNTYTEYWRYRFNGTLVNRGDNE